MTSGVLPYVKNSFWLLVPILAFNLVFSRHLPRAYQAEVFWKDIPSWIAIPENLFRLPVFLLPLVLRPRISTTSQRLGLWLYVAGTLVYFASWAAQISYPESAWSVSAAGFLAPAYTPALWIAGIGLMGDSSTLPRVPYRPWIYLCPAAAFLAFHNLHAWLVHSRQG